ncbi:hypothetical protein QUB70_24650 [Microcoleus sp. A003_D6]|uniref:hypothetical protein n=1 Tax=Microcoleus sp. A003_D6 TaxID=3055266 RepID=UPI002FD7107E
MDSEMNGYDWQQDFIATNLLALGYNAWIGYLGGERGAVICSLNSPLLGVAGETFNSYFVPRSRLAPFLNAWLAAPDTVILQHHHMNAHILQEVDNYNPFKDIILLLECANQAIFLNLRNLPISPPDCYQTVCKHWEDFQLETDAVVKRTDISR